MTGICGGYTTFSGFSIETVRFLLSHELGAAAIYIAASLVSWLVAVWAGDALADWIND
jgi:CrcB protein